MLRTVATDILRARRMPSRSPLTSVTWALFIATSVPVPMAMPTSARARAGASLMPSPAMATRWPCCCRRAARRSLSCGLTSPCTSSMPSSRATARAVVRPSPVAMITRTPSARRRSTASFEVGLIGSATASSPASAPSTARYMMLTPSPRSRSALACSGPASTPASVISAVLPSCRRRPSTWPRTPMPEADSNASGVLSARPRARA